MEQIKDLWSTPWLGQKWVHVVENVQVLERQSVFVATGQGPPKVNKNNFAVNTLAPHGELEEDVIWMGNCEKRWLCGDGGQD